MTGTPWFESSAVRACRTWLLGWVCDHFASTEGCPKLAHRAPRENRVFADSPPHRARTVRHFKSNGYILNKCFSKSTVTVRMDGLPHKWRTVRSSFGHPIQKDYVSAFVSVFKGGPSAPSAQTVRSSLWGWTVRSSLWTTIQSQNGSVRAQTRQQRTVRHPEADRQQVYFQQKCTSVKRS